MHQGQGRLEALVAQVVEEVAELRGGEHPLVDQRPTRQRREVHRGGAVGVEHLVLDPLAHDVGEPVQGDVMAVAVDVGQEQLAERRHGVERGGADARRVDRDGAPPEHLGALLGADLLDRGGGRISGGIARGQERGPDGVGTPFGQVERQDSAEEGVGDLNQDAGAVAGVRLCPGRAPVVEVAQRGEALGDQVVAGAAVEVAHEGDAAGVVFGFGAVEAHRSGALPGSSVGHGAPDAVRPGTGRRSGCGASHPGSPRAVDADCNSCGSPRACGPATSAARSGPSLASEPAVGSRRTGPTGGRSTLAELVGTPQREFRPRCSRVDRARGASFSHAERVARHGRRAR